MGYKELNIVETAFNKVKERFHVPVELKSLTREGKAIVVNYTETDNPLAAGVRFTQSFSPYWFDSTKWEQVMEPERKKKHGYLNYGVEKLVPPTADYNEDTLATLRVAAKLYWVFRHSGLIR